MGEDNFGFDVSDQDSQDALWIALLTNKLLTVKFLISNRIEIVPIEVAKELYESQKLALREKMFF